MARTCPRCRFTDHFGDTRFWSGNYVEVTDDGEREYELLCDDCHRDVVRN